MLPARSLVLRAPVVLALAGAALWPTSLAAQAEKR